MLSHRLSNRVHRASIATSVFSVIPLRALILGFATLALVSPASAGLSHEATPAEALPPGRILQELHALGQLGRVLYVAAHPDDENTRLLATLALGHGYRTGYLSLTRGDGGQNLIGSDLRDRLGVIRTHELIAARRIDGAVQFFTRANDFGFSKHPDETFRIWDRRAVLADVVRVIRTFRPHILVTRFSTEPGITHGHHTASALLTIEAFDLAGDASAFPEQLADGTLRPWQPTRVLWNAWPAAFRSAPRKAGEADPATLQLDSGGYSALLGESFGEIAARSRTAHKSQGFGTLGSRGANPEYFRVLAGEPARRDPFEGIDLSWSRLPLGDRLTAELAALTNAFDPRAPAASVPALLRLRLLLTDGLTTTGSDPTLREKRRHLDRIIAACLGLHTEARVHSAEVTPGETVSVRLGLIVRSAPSDLPIRWVSSVFTHSAQTVPTGLTLAANRAVEATADSTVPAEAALTTPYWLRDEGTAGMFRVDDPALIGRPESPPAFPVQHTLEIGGQTLVFDDEAVEVIDDPVRGEIRRPLRVVAPVTLGFPQELALFAPGSTRDIDVTITAERAPRAGALTLEAPAGFAVSPSSQAFQVATAGSQARLTFQVTAPREAASGNLVAAAQVDGRVHRTGRVDLRYEHIPAQLLQPRAQARLVSLELAVTARRIGYLAGAGDLVAEALTRMGCSVTALTAADLTVERLATFDAVVMGVRAYNTRPEIVPLLPKLFAYVERGGTLVVQYNTTADLQTTALLPFPLKLSRDRVTDEDAAVTLLAPDHPALNRPNRIVPADFTGWVQERGLYFPSDWDARFTPLLACADPGEKSLRGALLVAPHGRGQVAYTGLSFFRQLPAGVPGAYRLFANLVSLGQ
jgi:LmbE family N-acetylglucosaminyl deacetylase